MVTSFAIVTLVFFFVSTIFVIHPLSFHVSLPILGRRKLTVGLMSAPILAIAILWASQCLGPTQIRNGIVGTDGVKPYNILILFISLAYIAITLDITGILQAAAFWVSNKGGSNGRKLFLYFYLLLTGVSMFLGNDPVILSGTAFLVYYTAATELDPDAWLISEFSAANTASMVLFVGNPTNVVICEGFNLNNAAFTAYTILPFLACNLACYIALLVQFRDEKHVPRKLNKTEHLDVRKALLDPIGALVGSIILAACLITVIILSFFHVDVWKVVLPFAAAKFVFDIAWDHYRFLHEKIPDRTILGSENTLVAMDAEPVQFPPPTTTSTFSSHRSSTFTKTTFSPKIHDSNTLPASTLHDSITLHDSTTLQQPHDPDIKDAETGSRSDDNPQIFPKLRSHLQMKHEKLLKHFPTFFIAFTRLPFGLIPFAFSQFILIEALAHQGWIDIFGHWLVRATNREMIPTIWIVGVIGVILCNVAGTNIGATILLTKVVHAAPGFSDHTLRGAAIALAVASNIGAISFTFSASLAGLLWKTILKQKGITFAQSKFAFWNCLPLAAMTSVGLAIVCAELAVLYRV